VKALTLALALALACVVPGAALASSPILVVDLSESYARSSALSGLLADVDKQLKALALRHGPELDRLRGELRLLKQGGPGNRDQQLAIARKISDIEAAVERDEERLAAANQAAIDEVQGAIAAAKAALKAEAAARAILDIHETHYVRADCPCLATDRLYQLLNERLPKVELRMVPAK